MLSSVSNTQPTLVDEAAFLRSYLAEKKDDALDRPDIFLMEVLRRFDTAAIVTLVETIGYPEGSVCNIILYKLWLEVWTDKSPDAFAIWYNLGIQYGVYGDVTNRITCYKNALVLNQVCIKLL